MGARATFGCPECWPDSAEAAWEAGLKIERRRELVDESHFHVMIVTCGSCRQAFLWVFTELIDWAAGDDSQAWARIPLAAEEERHLVGLPEDAIEQAIYAVGEDRRSVWKVHPRGKPAWCSWSRGVLRLPHD